MRRIFLRQRSFYEGTLRPLMDRAERSELVLLFPDASHFVMGCDFHGYIYGTVRRFVRIFSVRKRYIDSIIESASNGNKDKISKLIG